MLKKILIAAGLVLAITIAAAYLFREQLFFALMASQIKPELDFAQQPAPAPPDYAKKHFWAALPEIEDPADERPEGVSQSSNEVAAFFVHPTSYFGKTWNQPLPHSSADWIVDERILRHQASVFNSCCEIYAPRYRQATFFAFLDSSDSASQALALAYADVASAFDNFLQRIGPDQSFVLAGHSQGTRHAAQLLREKISGSPLQQRLVTAYLIGFSITYDQTGGLPICEDATQTGCVVAYNAVEGKGGGAFGDTPNLVCVNPLNWRHDDSYAANTLNNGAIGFPSYNQAEPGEDITAMRVELNVADAQCINGQVVISDLRSDSFPARMLGNSLHVYDYSLFHMNLRENIERRIQAFR